MPVIAFIRPSREGRMSDNDAHRFTDDYQVEADFRGETLTYTEGNQRTQMQWTWTNGYTVYSDSIEPWKNADGSRSPLSADDRTIILQRVVKYALEVQHVKMKVE
jgi:hypothetical protein